MSIEFKLMDWDSIADQQSLVSMFDDYSMNSPHLHNGKKPDYQANLVRRLQDHNAIVFIARETDTQSDVGFCICFMRLSSHTLLDCLYIHDVGITHAFRGQGLSRKLLEFVEDYARSQGCGSMTLEVRSSNTVAKHLYTSFGFKGPSETIPADASGYMSKYIDPQPAAITR